MKSKLLRSSNERGAVLLTILCVMTVMMVLVGAAVTFVNQTTQRTYSTFQSEQAYMTASTCLESFVSEIEKKTADIADATEAQKLEQEQAILQLQTLAKNNAVGHFELGAGGSSSADIDRMGTCEVKISNYTTDQSIIVITATAKFGKQQESVAAYVVTTSKKKPATYSNAIELTASDNGTISYDNLNVLGDMASITGKADNSGRTYTFDNKGNVNGSILIFGNFQNSNNAYVILQPSLKDTSGGSHVTVTNDFINAKNPLYIGTVMPYSSGYNYVNVGGKIKVTANGAQTYIGAFKSVNNIKDKPNMVTGYASIMDSLVAKNDESDADRKYEVDVYCTGIESVASYYQVGNLYCYKDSLGTGGDITFENDTYIVGDVYVEGNLNVKKLLVVYGNLYVGGKSYHNGSEITASTTFSQSDQGIYVYEDKERTKEGETTATFIRSGFTMTKTGRGEVPEIPSTANEYVYFPEDMLVSDDATVGLLKDDYLKFYQYTIDSTTGEKKYATRTVSEIFLAEKAAGNEEYVTTDGAKFVVNITENCRLTGADLVNLCQNYGQPGNPKVLFTVKDSDMQLFLDRSLSGNEGWMPQIVVRNLSSDANEKFMYIVPDAIAMDDSGKYMTDKVSAHGPLTSTDDHTWDGTGWYTPSYGTYGKFTIISYDTYINLYDSSVYGNKGGCIANSSLKTGAKLNLSSNSTLDGYNPKDGQIIMLLTHGSTFASTNDTFIEATIYAPEASVKIKTQSSMSFAPGSIAFSENGTNTDAVSLITLGMVICNDFDSDNTAAYSFNAPSENSLMGLAKGQKTSTLTGYTLLRYDHH